MTGVIKWWSGCRRGSCQISGHLNGRKNVPGDVLACMTRRSKVEVESDQRSAWAGEVLAVGKLAMTWHSVRHELDL